MLFRDRLTENASAKKDYSFAMDNRTFIEFNSKIRLFK
jgi:hypothetical protein